MKKNSECTIFLLITMYIHGHNAMRVGYNRLMVVYPMAVKCCTRCNSSDDKYSKLL